MISWTGYLLNPDVGLLPAHQGCGEFIHFVVLKADASLRNFITEPTSS